MVSPHFDQGCDRAVVLPSDFYLDRFDQRLLHPHDLGVDAVTLAYPGRVDEATSGSPPRLLGRLRQILRRAFDHALTTRRLGPTEPTKAVASS